MEIIIEQSDRFLHCHGPPPYSLLCEVFGIPVDYISGEEYMLIIMGSGGEHTIYNMRSYGRIIAYYIEEKAMGQKSHVSTGIQ